MSRLSVNTRLQIMWCCVVGINWVAAFLFGASLYAHDPWLALPTVVFIVLGAWVLAATLWVCSHEAEIRRSDSVSSPESQK